MSGKLFLGGVPTGPEVDALLAEVRPAAGVSVTYVDVERIIACGRNTNRFRTITVAWRHRLFRDHGIQTKAEGGQFLLLTADAALDLANERIHRVGRATGKLVKGVSVIRIDELSTDERRRQHFMVSREASALLEMVRKSSKTLTEPAPKGGEVVRIA